MMTEKSIESGASPDLLMALGRMTANFNLLEAIVRASCAVSLGAKSEARDIAMADLPFSMLATKFKALWGRRSDDPAAVKKLGDRLEAVGEKRNRFVHAIWLPGETPGAMTRAMRVTARGGHGLQIRVVEVSATDVNDLAQEIATLSYEVLVPPYVTRR